MESEEVTKAINALAATSPGSHVKSHLVALVGKIPVAGTNLATAIRNHNDKRRMERICAVLTHLHERTQGHDEKLKDVLTEDQAAELLHETLAAAAVTSDEQKLGMLKFGLANSFVDAELGFAEKQYFMGIAKDLSILEATLLAHVYGADPHVRYELLEQPEMVAQGLVMAPKVSTMLTLNRNYEETYEEDSKAPTLLAALEQRFGDWRPGAVVAVAGRLDGRGLTSLAPNFGGQTVLVLREVPHLAHTYVRSASHVLAITLPQSTPMQRSRNSFGEAFLQFVRYG